MNKNQKLFADKSMEFAEELYKRADSELLKLLKQQKINRDTVMGKVAEIMLKYEIKDTKLNLSNSEFKKLYSEFKLIIVEVLKSEAEKEVDTLKELLTTVGTDKFYSNSFLLSLGMNFELQKVSDKVMKEVVNKKIQGMNFVDRTWENKTNKVAKILQNEVKEFLQGKTNLNRIEQVIKHRFNSDASITKRLVRNEVARVQTEINEVWAKDHNVDWQMWMATLDDKTSEICQRYDGKTWKRTDPRKKIPIEDSHINCRCCLVSLPSEDYRPDKRIDNKTKEDIDWKDYNEWKNSSIFDEIAVSLESENDISHLQNYYTDSINKGNIPSDLSFEEFRNVAEEANERLVGLVVENGITIEGISYHLIERIIGNNKDRKGVSVDGIVDSMKNPLKIMDNKIDAEGRKSFKVIGNKATTSINPDTGTIIQVNPTKAKTAIKYKKGD